MSKHFPRSKDLSEEQFHNENFFRQFSTYSTEFAISSSSKNLIMSRTAVNYFGAAKEFARSQFPENDMFEINRLDKWYTLSRLQIEIVVNRRCMKSGLATSESSRPIGRALRKKICHTLMLNGDSDK